MIEYSSSSDGFKADYPGGSYLANLISRGEYLKAYDLGDEYLRSTGKPDPDIIKQHALCMSKLGMIDRSISLLENLNSPEAGSDNEISAFLGSFYKNKWLKLLESDPQKAETALVSSFNYYMKSRESDGDFWCTINAATLALVLGKTDLSQQLADEVIEACWEQYNEHGTTSEFWIPASMGEAYLIKKDYHSAVRWYKAARSHIGSSIGQIKTTRTNARMLLDLHETDDDTAHEILECIRKPRIAVFAGHRIDRPGRTNPRFPEYISSRMKNRLKKKLIEMKLDIGISSAADGADILFHECLQEMGKRTHVILPSPIEHFQTKVFKSKIDDWPGRFDKIIKHSDRVVVTSSSRFASNADGSYKLSSDYMLEYSLDLTDTYDGELLPVIIWDHHPDKQPGGTAYIVSQLRMLGFEPTEIPITGIVQTRHKHHKGSVSQVNEYPYSSMGIYEPAVRPILVISNNDKNIMQEELASGLNSISEQISHLAEEETLRFLSSGVISGKVYLILDSVYDTLGLIRSINDSSPALSEYSLVLHAGLVTMLNSSLSGRRDYYCGEIDEALEIAANLKSPAIIASMQFKSIASNRKYPNLIYKYRSRLRSKNGNLLNIYQLSW